MKHSMTVVSFPAKEFLVLKGYCKFFDPGADLSAATDDSWDIIDRRFADGSVERLKEAAGSDAVYMLFCNTCVRDDAGKCYLCGYDVACENVKGNASDDFETVKLTACDYALYDCDFDSEIALKDAHKPTDELFWGESGWLKNSGYICAIDEPENWAGNGYAQIERYTPFAIEAKRFNMKIWYPLLRK